MARSLKFQIKEEEGLYYLCCGNIDADQLRSNEANLSTSLFSHMQTDRVSVDAAQNVCCHLYLSKWN